MAAKAKAAPVAKKATAQKAQPKGLVLTTAQWKAYTKAYAAAATATRNRLVLQAAVNSVRRNRLSTAYGIRKTLAANRQMVRAAAIAAQASRTTFVQSRRSHQNVALMHRVEQNMSHHAQILARLQYVRGGERAYAKTAIARTLTVSQATAYERRVLAILAKTASKGKKSVKNVPFKVTPMSAAVNKAANAAGLAAARKVKTPKAVVAKAAAPKTSSKTAKNVVKPKAVKAAVKATPRAASKPNWAGDEETPNCVVIALVNHLLRERRITATAKDIAELVDALHEEPTIEEVLWQAWLMAWPMSRPVRITNYHSMATDTSAVPGSIVGYDTEYGPHAALVVGLGKVISWGSVMEITAPIEEAWNVSWQT